MPDYTPIPTPFLQRWRQFRFQALPLLVGAAAAAGVFTLWQAESGVAIVGQVEAPTGEVSSPESGTLGEITVTRFVSINSGDTVATLIKTPPDVLRSSLAVLKAEIELTRLGWIDPVLDQRRNLLQLESLKIDWLTERADLAIDEIRFQQAEREYARHASLLETGMVSVEAYEQARTAVEVLRTTVLERTGLVASIGESLSRLQTSESVDDDLSGALRATLVLQEERLKLMEAELRPIALKSPISGVISEVHRRPGESVRAGDRIITVRAPEPDGIFAYVREPIPVTPEVGMTVEVRSRRHRTVRAQSRIVAVGPQIEEMIPSLKRPFFEGYQAGLPIYVSLPEGIDLLPGEIVDIEVR